MNTNRHGCEGRAGSSRKRRSCGIVTRKQFLVVGSRFLVLRHPRSCPLSAVSFFETKNETENRAVLKRKHRRATTAPAAGNSFRVGRAFCDGPRKLVPRNLEPG